MKTIYECSQSKGIKWVTAFFFLIVVFSILALVYAVSKGMSPTLAIIFVAILLVISFSCFLVCPMYIITDDEGIGIRTPIRTIKIPYENIDHIERFGEQRQLFIFKGQIGKVTLGTSFRIGLFSAGNTMRQFGIGGVFGYIGWFSTKDIGTFLSFVTDTKKVFLIYRINGEPIAISVSEPDEFLPYYLKGASK
jgi:heme/copper-type cytochrome/quinol oxidase subunit 4